MKQFIFTALLWVISTISTSAQVINTLFYKYPQWSEELEERAKTDFPAKVVVGYYYLEGKGVEQNAQTAVKWFKEAISQPHDDIGRAYFFLGQCSKNGFGTEKDAKLALSYYTKAIDCEYPFYDAYIEQALIYEMGNGIPEDMDKAMELYELGIKYGRQNIISRSYIGKGRILGRQGKTDEAIRSFIKGNEINGGSDKKIEAIAYMNLGCIYDYILNDFESAAKYYKKSINSDVILPDVVCRLGDFYFEGKGVPQNKNKAKKLYQSASKRGDSDASKKLKELTF